MSKYQDPCLQMKQTHTFLGGSFAKESFMQGAQLQCLCYRASYIYMPELDS